MAVSGWTLDLSAALAGLPISVDWPAFGVRLRPGPGPRSFGTVVRKRSSVRSGAWVCSAG